ncbi:Ribosomal subunit interface protein [Croceitalea dokdonensis DOKDO 023]|uniref:Ribosomal subunit interface protein n=1 Tax=Croceitalea dokdonensis DOKDO 023 TaxID=1300341 RepID=A0A0P7ANA5_9FLAO|nr:ribosome-associated translation inhibitor RaiA [Croceitalea dokdonensis]KPM33405.1 Ribosomal subunit interface protein [Croceitalea dokdonensis DOKDO 023]
MQIVFEYDGVTASEALEAHISQKLNKLEGKYDFIIDAKVFLKTTKTHSPTSGKSCNVRLSVPGPDIFAETDDKDFTSAFNHTFKELESQLSTKKGKMKSH